MTHDQLDANHYTRLNGYRDSQEYADFAASIGHQVEPGDKPSLLGNRWEIDAEIYDHFLGILPPLGWKNGSFFMSEFSFDDITAKYTKEGEKYYCEFARFDRRSEHEIPGDSPKAASRYLSKWLDIGKKNLWIREAEDPPFNTRSFRECKDDAELLAKFEHGNWSLGQAFHIGDLCFINQIDGGDEWLTIKQDQAFESVSFGSIIRKQGLPAAQALLDRFRAASVEKCRGLNY